MNLLLFSVFFATENILKWEGGYYCLRGERKMFSENQQEFARKREKI